MTPSGHWFGVDLGGAFAAQVDPRSAVEHHVLQALAHTWATPDFVLTHVVPGIPGSAWVSRIGVSVRLLADGDGWVSTAGRVEPAPPSDAVGALLAERLGGVASPELADLSERKQSGRCVRFPGQRAVRAQMSAGAIVRATAIDQVAGTGVVVDATDVVHTGGYLRPCFEAGALVLLVGPAAGGRLVPLETATRHECCAGVH